MKWVRKGNLSVGRRIIIMVCTNPERYHSCSGFFCPDDRPHR